MIRNVVVNKNYNDFKPKYKSHAPHGHALACRSLNHSLGGSTPPTRSKNLMKINFVNTPSIQRSQTPLPCSPMRPHLSPHHTNHATSPLPLRSSLLKFCSFSPLTHSHSCFSARSQVWVLLLTTLKSKNTPHIKTKAPNTPTLPLPSSLLPFVPCDSSRRPSLRLYEVSKNQNRKINIHIES